MRLLALIALTVGLVWAETSPMEGVQILTSFDSETGHAVVDVHLAAPPEADIYQASVLFVHQRSGRIMKSTQTLDLTRSRFRNHTYSFRFPIALEDIQEVAFTEMSPARIATKKIR
jgi:hypothetical protein